MGEQKTMFGRAHAVISASKMEIIYECPGSVYLSEQAPPEAKETQSVYAAEGTLAASIAEEVLTDWLVNDVDIVTAFNKVKLKFPDKEMEDHIFEYCMTCAKLLQGRDVVRVAVEKAFCLSKEIESFGTSDFALSFKSKSGKKCLQIMDLKYGQGHVVEVERNKQVITYVVAADRDPEWGPFDLAAITIYQPRVEHPDGPIRTMRFTRAELDYWYDDIMKHGRLAWEIKRRLDNGQDVSEFEPVYRAGDHCRWCRGQITPLGICPAFRAEHIGLPETDFGVVDSEEKLPAINSLTDPQVLKLILHEDVFKNFLKRVHEYAMNRQIANQPILDENMQPALKLIRGRSTRKWAPGRSPQAIADALAMKGLKDPWDRELKGFGAIEKVIGKGQLDDLTVKPEGKLKLVSISDPTPEASPSHEEAASDFCD